MACFEARPEHEARAGVVVVQEAFGVNDHIRDVTGRFARAGYHALAPDLFHREAAEPLAYDDLEEALALVRTLTDDGILADLDAAFAHLHQAGFGFDRIGTVGFCMGGRVTFLAAARRAIGAAVGFYGGGIVTARMPNLPPLVGEAAHLRAPWLGLFGDLDASIPVEDVEALRAALEAAPLPHEVVRYPSAGHGFHCDARASFQPEAAADAWTRTLDWLERHLG